MQFPDLLSVAGKTLLQHLVIRVRRRCHEVHAGCLQFVEGINQIFTGERDVLYALPVVLQEVFLYLALAAATAFFIEGYADPVVGGGHCTRQQTGLLALKVEVANFPETEIFPVKLRPIVHPPPVHVMCQMIDLPETQAFGVRFNARKVTKINVEKIEPINQIQRRTPDTLDGGQSQFHRTHGDFKRLSAHVHGPPVRELGISDLKRKSAGAGPMFLGVEIRKTSRFVIDYEIDIALPPQMRRL